MECEVKFHWQSTIRFFVLKITVSNVGDGLKGIKRDELCNLENVLFQARDYGTLRWLTGKVQPRTPSTPDVETQKDHCLIGLCHDPYFGIRCNSLSAKHEDAFRRPYFPGSWNKPWKKKNLEFCFPSVASGLSGSQHLGKGLLCIVLNWQTLVL